MRASTLAAAGLWAVATVWTGQGPPRLAAQDLAWMAGTWSAVEGGRSTEEHWTAPGGGALLGLHRDVAQGKMVSFEFLRIEETREGLTYFAQPRGRPATSFVADEVGPRKVVFANPEHDFPQRILYWLDEAGALHARIEGSLHGKPASEEWRWTKR